MSEDSTRPPGQKADPDGPRHEYGGTDRYEALLEVMEQEVEKVRGEGALGAVSRTEGKIRLVVVTLLIAALGLVQWKGDEWLGPEPIPPPSAMELEQSLRAAMYLQAQRIKAFSMQNGRLPDTLDEAGQPMPGMQYAKLGNGTYQLMGENRGVSLTYRSDQPAAQLLGAGEELFGAEGDA